MEIMTRTEAARKGLTFYSSGKSCKHGHDAVRYTCNGICVECNKANNSKLTKELRFGRNNRLVNNFVYESHPDDHAALLAFAQALDMQRGRIPKQQLKRAAATPPPPITSEAIQEHRARLLNQMTPASQPHMPAP